jgi:chaperone required for assembly of F1-ATPase
VKRFWKAVAVARDDGGWGIALDGRPVRTPKRAPLAVASLALAEAVAAEWRDVGETIDPAYMPMTGLTNAAIDLAAPDLIAFSAPIAAYAESDLLCYRDARDAALQAEQAAAWNPLLAWAEARYGIEFTLAQGVLPVDQPAMTIAALQDAVLGQDTWRDHGFDTDCDNRADRWVAGLALIENAFDAESLWNAVSLDDLYQERRWGADSEAQKARAVHKRDWDNAARFLTLL